MKLIFWFKKLLNFIFKRQKKRRVDTIIIKASLDASQRCLFSKEQEEVINQGIAYGYNMKDIAKVKYSAKQMTILLHAKMLDVDYSDFSAYTMSPLEMEYHLYLATIDRYLGNSYLKNLFQGGKYSIGDPKIKRALDKALEQQLEAYSEIASSNTLEITEESCGKIYALLRQLCNQRGIDTRKINLGTVEEMKHTYALLCDECIKNAPIINKEDLQNCSIYNSDIDNLTLEELQYPVIVSYKQEVSKLMYYYVVYSQGNIYLVSQGKITIRYK